MFKTLALFDFDGTLTTKDTLSDFIFFSCSRLKVVFSAVVLAPVYYVRAKAYKQWPGQRTDPVLFF